MKGTNPTKDASYCTSTRCPRERTRLRVSVTIRVFGSQPRLPSAAQTPAEQQPVERHDFVSLFQCFSFVMILPKVHLRKPCYDFYFL